MRAWTMAAMVLAAAAAGLATMAPADAALAAPKGAAPRHIEPAEKRPDLADALAGTYDGAVTSDARGSSRGSVAITVTRIGRNQINISSDYRRIPDMTAGLENASGTILSTTRGITIVVDRNKDPNKFDLSADGVTFLGRRR